MLSHFRGDWAPLNHLAEELVAFADEQRLSQWHIWARVYAGIATTNLGGGELAMLRKAIEDSRQIGPVFRPYFLTSYADCCHQLGDLNEGHDALDEAIAIHDETGEAWWLPEIHRVRGDLISATDELKEREAEVAYFSALRIARGQQAKSLELRAAHSLARLWHAQGRSDEARDVLAPVYGWFTEGFDTADLKEAKALLDALG